MNLNRVKGDSSGVIEHIVLVAMLAFVAALFVHNNLLWRWDNLLYDAQLSFWSRTVADDIIIIAIDDESLNELGRWPWPRDLQGQLFEALATFKPRMVAVDIAGGFSKSNVFDGETTSSMA